MRIAAIWAMVVGAAALVLIGCESDAPTVQSVVEPEPVSAVVLDRSMRNSEFEIIGGGWQCFFHGSPPQGLQLRHVETGAAWELNRQNARRDLEPGVYQLVVPDTSGGVIGSCGRIGTSVAELDDAAEAAESQAAVSAEAQAAAVEQAIEAARAEGEAAGRAAGRILGRDEGLAEGRAEERAQQSQSPPEWVHAAVNPDEPAACEDPRALSVRGTSAADGTTVFELKVAVRFRDDGVVWAAVEDSADGPTACHVYSVEDWTYNPATGWMHSGPIRIAGY